MRGKNCALSRVAEWSCLLRRAFTAVTPGGPGDLAPGTDLEQVTIQSLTIAHDSCAPGETEPRWGRALPMWN